MNEEAFNLLLGGREGKEGGREGGRDGGTEGREVGRDKRRKRKRWVQMREEVVERKKTEVEGCGDEEEVERASEQAREGKR